MTLPIWAQYAITILIGYLFGCSNMAYYLSKLYKIDIRKGGSGNLGASNAMIILGKKAGLVTGLHDILKATLAVVLCRMLFSGAMHSDALAGSMAVIGHMYPFWLKFKGGKGFASYIGMALGISFWYCAALAIVIILVTVISDYIVFATMTTVILTPIYLLITGGPIPAVFAAFASACIIWKHRENFVRLKNHEEIGLRRTMSGKDRQTK